MRKPGSHNSSPSSERRTALRRDPVLCAHHDAIYTLARASELHDEETGNHVLRIRHVVERLALEMEFAPGEASALGYDAMLHDVGKLLVPREILSKAAPLTDEERRVLRSHTVQGERLLQDRSSMQRAASIARSHHERWDGAGYPDGLAGEVIPLAARITAGADVLDALMSARAYKRAWSYRQAMDEVLGATAGQLDPTVVEALRRCDRREGLREVYPANGA